MATRPKTGGRSKGTPNKAKSPPPGTQAEAGEAPAPLYFLPSARAREGKVDKAVSGGRDLLSTFPRHRIVEVENLVPYARNARTHTAAQIDKIAVSIREFGFTNPVLTDGKGGIIAGHGRVLAAAKLGMATVPTVELSHLTAEQRRAYVLADNRLALDAGWDSELLAEELSALRDAGFDLALTGFDGDELSRLFDTGGDGLADPDDLPEIPAYPVSVAGDVWVLGRHRVMCGDSANPADVAQLVNGAEADLCFTSPPYGQQRDYEASIADWDKLMVGVFGALPMREGGQLLVNLGLIHRDGECVPYWDAWIAWMRSTGWRRFGWYVWDQGPGLPGGWNGRLAPAHEWIFHFNKTGGFQANKSKPSKLAGSVTHEVGSRSGLRGKDGIVSKFSHAGRAVQAKKIPDSIIRVMRLLDDYDEALSDLSDEDIEFWPDSVVRVIRHKGQIGKGLKHPAPFPVALPTEIIRAYSKPGELVYEPFCGAGSTIIACEQHDRRCFGMEIAALYVDVAVLRWQAFTGQAAVLEADGFSYDQVAAMRHDVKPGKGRRA